MKTENISDAMNLLDDDIVEHTAELREKNRRTRRRSWGKWCAAAACLCLICVGAFAVSAGLHRGEPDNDPENSIVSNRETEPSETEPGSGGSEQNAAEYVVAVASLLAPSGNVTTATTELAQRFAKVPVEGYTGIYNEIPSVKEDILSASTGAEVSGAAGWYRILGHEDLQYLIRKEEQGCSLWKFESFSSDEYPYRDVLELIYHVDSADHITEIEVNPSKRDNTDEGRRIQEEIGTRVITDAAKIEQMYQVISALTCYGSDNWDRIDLGNMDVAADTGLSSDNSFRLERYLSFTIDYGNKIDGLKYAGYSGTFFEFSGIAYEPLTEEQAELVGEILGCSK